MVSLFCLELWDIGGQCELPLLHIQVLFKINILNPCEKLLRHI